MEGITEEIIEFDTQLKSKEPEKEVEGGAEIQSCRQGGGKEMCRRKH